MRSRRRAVALAAAAVLAAGCSPDSAGPERGVTTGDLVDDVLQVEAGSTVTVSAEVSDVFGPHAFALAGDTFGGERLLVVGAADPAVEEGEVVRVTGVVTPFDRPRFEAELNVDLAPAEEDNTVGFTDQRALRATEVVRVKP